MSDKGKHRRDPMRHWRIRNVKYDDGAPYGPVRYITLHAPDRAYPWCVSDPEGNWTYFDTHTNAINYATRQHLKAAMMETLAENADEFVDKFLQLQTMWPFTGLL
jgi:hypothetical protein